MPLARPLLNHSGDREPAKMPVEHSKMANAIRALAMDAVEQAKSGHPGLPMGAADVATVLARRLSTPLLDWAAGLIAPLTLQKEFHSFPAT